MATGIVKGEKLGEDALLADSVKSEPYALPSQDAAILLMYPNKIEESEVLAAIPHEFSLVAEGSAMPVGQLRPNAFILADNFYGLDKLRESQQGKITLVYLDPPYGTGLEFQSRSLQHAYKDLLGPASWLEFMRRRLILMRELLTDDGSIYVQIGFQMVFHLKAIMDEVFGTTSFRNLIVRKKCSSKNYTKNQYPNLHDYILFYSKSRKYKWNRPGIEASNEWIEKEYPRMDAKGRYKLVPIHAPGVRNGETGQPWRGMVPPPGKHWQLSPSKLDDLDAQGDIHWSSNGNPRRKVYLPKQKFLPLTDYWDQYRDAHHQSIMITGYPTEKNLEMLKMIVSASSDPGDMILDPFCGSGTTLHAARDLDRKWFGIDQSFAAAEATLHRMRYGLKPMGDYVSKNGDAGSQTLSLFEDNPADLRPTSRATEFQFVVDTDVLRKHKDQVMLLARI